MKAICQKKAKCIHGGFGILLHPGDPSINDPECKACEYRESLRLALCGSEGPKGTPNKGEIIDKSVKSVEFEIPTWDSDGRDHDIKRKK